MKTKRLKNKDQTLLHLEMWELEREGWKVIKYPFKNWFGNWICKLEKS